MKRLILAAFALATLTTGCATAHLDTPSGFAAHDDDPIYDFRASDGEGVVVAVRTEKNDPKGDLAYWTAALDVQLRKAGYEALEAQDVTSADGHGGKQIRYVIDVDGRELVFWLSVFVTKREVVLVEAGGDAEFFGPKVTDVEAAIGSLRVG